MSDIFEKRREAFAEKLEHDNISYGLVTHLVNIRYLTGVPTSNAALLVGANGDVTLATDRRYATAFAELAPSLDVQIGRQVAITLVEKVVQSASHGVTLAIEEHDVTVELAAAIEKLLSDHSNVKLTHLGRLVERQRIVKDSGEIELLKRACAVSCQALEELYEAGGLLGRTEKAIARDLEWRMTSLGADGIAFETIVASGTNSAIPHHRPTDKTVEAGDLVKIDFGGTVSGYNADCTRTYVVGSAPADWQKEIYDVVAHAQRVGLEAVRAGAERIDVDAASRAVITDAGYGEHFGHATGHGIGLEAHEAPALGYAAKGKLGERMVVTVEPGIYLPGLGGVRIEDTVVVQDGKPDVLTTTTKDLLVLDG